MIKLKDLLEENPTRLYRLRTKSGSGVPKKTKAEIHKFLDKIWKKFRSSGSGHVETASEEMFPHPTYYAIKYQVARNSKKGKFRDWWFLKITKKGDGYLLIVNGVTKLQTWIIICISSLLLISLGFEAGYSH